MNMPNEPNSRIKEMLLNKKSTSEVCDVISRVLMERYIFKTIGGKKANEIFVYEDGIFIEKGKNVIEFEAKKIMGNYSKSHLIKEIKTGIEIETKVERNEMGCKDVNLICLKNGVLNIEERKLLPHSPDYCFMGKLPVNYNQEANCEKIFEFLSVVLDEEDIECIQEWFGYHLYREYFIKKAGVFRGIPDTGKTTFMNLLLAFIGPENAANISLQFLSQGKWYLTHLHNKHANVCDDLNYTDIQDSGTFKQVTGRSSIHAEYKHGDQFSFINYAKLSFACNRIPKINSDVDDDAYWGRWLIFDFDNVFDSSNKDTDPHLIDKITSDSELSGLLNWALDGFDRLHQQGHFSYRRDAEENKRIMLGESSSIARFVNECLTNVNDDFVNNHELYLAYEEFCRKNGISVIESLRKFFIDIRNYCSYGRFGSNKDNKHGARHVRIKYPIIDLRLQL